MPQIYRTKAQKEAERVWVDSGCPFPVPIKDIIEQRGITLQPAKFEDSISGMMVTRENGSVVVAVNDEHHENRQRFTLAHELGHYLLHREARSIFVDGAEQKFYRDAEASTGTKLQEIEANAFAAELLMPEAKIRELVPEKLSSVDEGILERLAEDFEVSQSALVFRLLRLNFLEQ